MKPTPAEIALNKILKKPLQRNAGLQINISKVFTDVNGSIISKISPIVTNAGMDVSMPIYMFGQFDRMGGYRVANQIVPPSAKSTGIGNVEYLGTFVYGLDMPFLFATGLNTVKNIMNIGDIAQVFTDSLNTPSVYCWIIQSGKSASLASIFSNAVAGESEKITVMGMNYYFEKDSNIPNIQNINVTRIDHVGSYENMPINVNATVQVFDKQSFLSFPLSFTVDQYNLISTRMENAIDKLELAFLIKKNVIKYKNYVTN